MNLNLMLLVSVLNVSICSLGLNSTFDKKGTIYDLLRFKNRSTVHIFVISSFMLWIIKKGAVVLFIISFIMKLMNDLETVRKIIFDFNSIYTTLIFKFCLYTCYINFTFKNSLSLFAISIILIVRYYFIMNI